VNADVGKALYLDVELLATVIRSVCEAAVDDGMSPGCSGKGDRGHLRTALGVPGGKMDRVLVRKYLRLWNR
jgi:hypothetical protein